MDLEEARRTLGVPPGASARDLRTIFRERMRATHPDVNPGSAVPTGGPQDPAVLTRAHVVLQEAIAKAPDGRLPDADRIASKPRHTMTDPVEALRDSDTVWVGAPPDETYQRLLEAVSTLGGIGHVDRGLGLLEVIVRFEGGPSCSVLLTLQGRSHGTEIFCEMESIEAAPTPPIDPVLDAIVAHITGDH